MPKYIDADALRKRMKQITSVPWDDENKKS